MKMRQFVENRVKEQQKQTEAKEKDIENLEIQFQNAKEQVRVLESTTNEQKVYHLEFENFDFPMWENFNRIFIYIRKHKGKFRSLPFLATL